MDIERRVESSEGRAQLAAEIDVMDAVSISRRLTEITEEMARENATAVDDGRPEAERDAAHARVAELGQEVARLTVARAKIASRYSPQ